MNVSSAQLCKCFAVSIALLLASLPAVRAAEPTGKILYTIDFSTQPDGSAVDWLKQNGFFIELDGEKLNPRFANQRLQLSTDGEYSGIFGLVTAGKKINNVKRVEIEWSVERFAQGADWEHGNNRVAIATMFFFGTEKLSSGLPFGVNAAPYFISPFVSNVEPKEKMYTGKLYKKGGRYFSVTPPPNAAKIFITDFELKNRFQNVFGKQAIPELSGFAFQMNTKDTSGGAVASIRKVTFFGE